MARNILSTKTILAAVSLVFICLPSAKNLFRFLVKRQGRKLRCNRSFHQSRPRRNEAVNLPSSRQTRRPLVSSDLLRSGNGSMVFLFDLEAGLIFPPEIASTTQRPDIVIYSKSKKIVVLIELTCPLKDHISTAHELKTDSYLELLSNCRCNGWTAFLFPVEVGSRGFVAYSLTSCPKNLVSQAIWRRKQEMNVPRSLYMHPTPFIFGGTSGNGLATNFSAFKSVAAVVSDITLHWVCLTRCTECLARIFCPSAGVTLRQGVIREFIFFLSLQSVSLFFFKNATIRIEIFEIEICRLSIWHFVKSIPGFPDSRYRLPCQMCTEYQTFPHSQPQLTAKGSL